MTTLSEIEAAVESLPLPQKQELMRYLSDQLQRPGTREPRLPLVPRTGQRITQEEIDDARDSE